MNGDDPFGCGIRRGAAAGRRCPCGGTHVTDQALADLRMSLEQGVLSPDASVETREDVRHG